MNYAYQSKKRDQEESHNSILDIWLYID